MRLSEFLRKNIIETKVGEVANKFKFHKRRDTLFFEELLARYVIECERSGFNQELIKIGQKWMFLYFNTLLPETIKKIPQMLLLNTIMRKIWHDMGLIDDFHIEKADNIIRITSNNEGMTRSVGANGLMTGFYIGIINVLFHSSVQILDVRQEKESCSYAFRLDKNPVYFEGKTKESYRKLNEIAPIKGYALKDALEKKIFIMKKNNRIFFRGKSTSPVENTLFHLVGNCNILPGKMAQISYDFFREIVKKEASEEEKISLLKIIFQIMGWGIIRIVVKGKNIKIEIKNPPYGLDLKDNWEYIFRTFLGYMWLFDKNLKMKRVSVKPAFISAEYSH